MRFNRKQLDEAIAKARQRGFDDGRKVSRRRFYLGFLFGIALGAVGFFATLNYWDQISGFCSDTIQHICSGIG